MLSPLANPDGSAIATPANLHACFGGPHPGMCLFVFCDGSVRGLSTSIDLYTLTYLAARADGQAITASY